MNERINGFDCFNQPWESPEKHHERFAELLDGLELSCFNFTRRRDDGSEASLTSYCGVIEQDQLLRVATARTHAILSGMEEALPALAVPMRPSTANPQSRMFVQLTYATPQSPRYEPPF
ncbi:hypothetical protein ACFVJW_26565 [Streptomyces libani]|uniref:hypothetical protein n=1 Tax=Streptomyces nigrescens TaxID=1920 RepID=UPI00363258F4